MAYLTKSETDKSELSFSNSLIVVGFFLSSYRFCSVVINSSSDASLLEEPVELLPIRIPSLTNCLANVVPKYSFALLASDFHGISGLAFLSSAIVRVVPSGYFSFNCAIIEAGSTEAALPPLPPSALYP